MYDINIHMETLSKYNLIDCADVSYDKQSHLKFTDTEEYTRGIWKKLNKIYIGISVTNQIANLKEIGESVLGKKRTQESLKFLEKFDTNNYYLEIGLGFNKLVKY